MMILIAAATFIAWSILAWLLGSWLRLGSPDVWVLRAGLWLLGAAAAGAFWWFRRVSQPAVPDVPNDELDSLLRAANAKLRSGRLPHGAGLCTLPVVLVLGPPGSAKTSVVTYSGLDPELLAGKALEDGAVTPTRSINIWYSAGSVFVEPAATLLSDRTAWKALVRRIVPARLGPLLGRGAQAPRAALVCFDGESLFRAGDSVLAEARQLRERLVEVAQALGAPLPVYALFTRIDRIPFYGDFVRNLSKSEAAGVLGATLPLDVPADGLYADQQSARIGASFDDLFQSMAAARLELLARDSDDIRAGCAWEFPREFRKLRTAVTDLLVELCRPSQFARGPLLRGYYFSGVRPVIVEDAIPEAVPMRQPAGATAGATVLFRPPKVEVLPAAAAPARGGRRVPQWVFLPQLFRSVILIDRVAMGASAVSTRTAAARCILLISAAAAGLLCSGLFTISWARNRALAAEAIAAAQALPRESVPAGTASVDSLRRLDRLRQSLETLAQYRAEGAPLSYRWGLYHGNVLYPQLRRLYFERFRALLFSDTQTRLAETLRSLPAKPGPDYGGVYDTLKAYLITTSNHERSTRAFLAPVLFRVWSAGPAVDSDRATLAGRQFAFYADQLQGENPYTAANDPYAVAKGRDYLAQFAGVERIYHAMLADAAKAAPAVDFHRQYPGAAAAVTEPYIVSGAFTRAGQDFMKTAIRNPDRYFSGEQWVLGERREPVLDASKLEDQLRIRYQGDLLNEWRTYLKSASVVRYANLGDAARKLSLLAGNQSPLLALFALASENTAEPPAATAFQPVQAIVPPTATGKLLAPSNQPYMSALLELQSAVEQASAQPPDAAAAGVLTAAANAKVAARQAAQGFQPDPAGHVDGIVAKLLEDPITQVESLLRVLGPEELNGKGKALCSAMRPVLAKYPFDPKAAADASIADVNAVFRKPDGALWVFYNTNLQKLLIRQGAQFVAKPDATIRIAPAFLSFFNQAAAFSEVLYAGGSQDPHFAYSLKPVPVEGIQNLGLTLDGQALSYHGGTAAPKAFTWNGSAAHEAKASVRFGNGPDLVWSNSQGPWSIFRFVHKAERWQSAGVDYSLEWTIRIGKDPVTLPNGKPLTVRFDLNLGTLPPILQRGYFSSMACVAQVAR